MCCFIIHRHGGIASGLTSTKPVDAVIYYFFLTIVPVKKEIKYKNEGCECYATIMH